MHCIALHDISLQYITSHCVTLLCIALHYMTLHYNSLHYIALHDIALYWITLHCSTIHDNSLHYITLHSIIWHDIPFHSIPLHCRTSVHTYLSTCLPTYIHTVTDLHRCIDTLVGYLYSHPYLGYLRWLYGSDFWGLQFHFHPNLTFPAFKTTIFIDSIDPIQNQVFHHWDHHLIWRILSARVYDVQILSIHSHHHHHHHNHMTCIYIYTYIYMYTHIHTHSSTRFIGYHLWIVRSMDDHYRFYMKSKYT